MTARDELDELVERLKTGPLARVLMDQNGALARAALTAALGTDKES